MLRQHCLTSKSQREAAQTQPHRVDPHCSLQLPCIENRVQTSLFSSAPSSASCTISRGLLQEVASAPRRKLPSSQNHTCRRQNLSGTGHRAGARQVRSTCIHTHTHLLKCGLEANMRICNGRIIRRIFALQSHQRTQPNALRSMVEDAAEPRHLRFNRRVVIVPGRERLGVVADADAVIIAFAVAAVSVRRPPCP